MSSDGLSEIKSGENHLLILDGENVRVTLVLTKPASKFLRANVSKFVMLFENQYYDVLQDWRGNMNACKDAGSMIDQILHTSIILPHKVTSDISKIKAITSGLAKSLLKIARNLTSGDRNFFFMAQLVSDSKDKLKKKPPEILLGLNELLDLKVLESIDLSQFEPQIISEQELNVIAQRVDLLPNLTSDDKQELVIYLKDLNAAEREAALTSLQHSQKITSAASKRVISTKSVSNAKEANKEIKNLLKGASTALKANNFTEAVHCYEGAEVIAIQWKTKAIAKKYQEMALKTQISEFNFMIKDAKKNGPKFTKSGKIDDAFILYQNGQKASSSLFKLGFTEYEKSVKFFNKKLKEISSLEKESISEIADSEKIDKNSLLKKQKELIKMATKLEKQKDINSALKAYKDLTKNAEKLFKIGVSSASGTIRRFNSKINELKTKLEITSTKKEVIDEEGLVDQRNQLLNIALEAEQSQDIIKAIIAYQQIINIDKMLGDKLGVDRLVEKKNQLRTLVPDIDDELSSIVKSAENNIKIGEKEQAFKELQYAKGLSEAIEDQKTFQQIEKLLNRIS